MDGEQQQRFMNIVAVLVEKLGGEVTITEAEIQSPPEGEVTTTADGKITFKTGKRND